MIDTNRPITDYEIECIDKEDVPYLTNSIKYPIVYEDADEDFWAIKDDSGRLWCYLRSRFSAPTLRPEAIQPGNTVDLKNEYKFTLQALQVAFETGFKSGFLEASGGGSPEMGKVVGFEEHIRNVFGIDLYEQQQKQKPTATTKEEAALNYVEETGKFSYQPEVKVSKILSFIAGVNWANTQHISEETVPDILGMCITEPPEHSPWIPGVNC